MSDDEASSHDSDSGSKPEESLVHGRARRVTAGNRMSILLQAIGDEDVQNDLLADEEEDLRDYEASDDGGDIDLESSESSDDEGPPREGEEEKLEGEKELQKLERIEAKKKKRKAHDLLKSIPTVRKKVKLADDASTTTAPDAPATASKPRKKSERTSWLPTAEDAPSRQSLRKATVLNKEQTEMKLKESQKRSEKAHELLRIAAEKRAANASPALTQADRIARALKTEKENSKSLNKWVQVEEERRTLQRKRMEALRNRQIEGPVIRYWSASAIWEGDKIKIKRVHKPKVELVEEGNAKPSAAEQPKEPAAQPDTVVHLQHDSDVDPETAEAAANADVHIKMTAQEAPAKQIDEGDRSQDQMQARRKSPQPPEETETTRLDAPKPPSLTGVDSVSDPVNTHAADPSQDPVSQPASFLEGIHYWASQSPAPAISHATNDHSHIPNEAQSATTAQASIPGPERFRPPHRDVEHLQPQQIDHQLDQHAADRVRQELPSQQSSAAMQNNEHQAALPAKYLPSLPPTNPTTIPAHPQNVLFSTPHQNTGHPQHISPPGAGPTFAVAPQQPEAAIVKLPTDIPPPAPPAPLLREQALRTLLTLDAFPELENAPTTTTSSRTSKTAITATPIASILLPDAHPALSPAEQKYLTAKSLKKKGDNFLPDRPAKASCCITAKEAKFRDPKTGLGYRDLAAFKSLQRVIAGGCAWSVQEESWVGIVGDGGMGRVAQGVPEGFWTGILPKKAEVKAEEGPKQTPELEPMKSQTPGQAQGQTSEQVQGQAPGQIQGHAPGHV
ncbi:YL1 nuclear protein-domain-containing protein [Delphinella strobiligena]|nr:YL1 nuclear protein-domain-containing protein [Delphinella strobiligena]